MVYYGGGGGGWKITGYFKIRGSGANKIKGNILISTIQ